MINTYNITLTEDEARTLLVITGNVLGSNTNSPRKHTTSVYEKLAGMLMECSLETLEHRLFKVMVGEDEHAPQHYIVFDDYPERLETPQQLKIEELEQSIANAQKQLEELKGLK